MICDLLLRGVEGALRLRFPIATELCESSTCASAVESFFGKAIGEVTKGSHVTKDETNGVCDWWI